MTTIKTSFLFLLTFFCFTLFAQDLDQLLQTGFAEGITVDLKEPILVDGVLSTDHGGVVTGPTLRIQAQHMRYTRQLNGQAFLHTIEAEGQLIVEFGEYVFTGEKLFYDFQKKEGTIFKGITRAEPWFLGGAEIHLLPEGDYLIYDGYVTTSENKIPDWRVQAQQIHIIEDEYLEAQHVKLLFKEYPVLWVPSLKTNLDTIFDSPIRYRFKWGGRQGPRFGLTYELLSWENWKIFFRFDYRFTRGPGGGLELYYHSPDHLTQFESVNYISKDSSIFSIHEKLRYRFEGAFRKLFEDRKSSILLTYDKVSDIDLTTVYYDRDFYFQPSKRTQLLARHQEEDWIGEFYSRVRVNNFQTVKQELPTVSLNVRPFTFGRTGVISENWARVSYLDFKYSHHLEHVHDYSATRFEYRPSLYRPFQLGAMTLTPTIGYTSIFYGNSPHQDSQYLFTAFCQVDAKTQFYRHFCSIKHVVEPYVSYQYYSYPTSTPHDHFIFDINDGWYRLNMLTVGAKNYLYAKSTEATISRLVFTHVYAHAFFNAKAYKTTIPKIYGQLVLFPIPTIRHTIDTAWDLEHGELDHLNFRTEWTWSKDFAISAELRHRDRFAWRKADPDNFFIEFFRTEQQLKHSPLSDRRDTFLLNFFYRFHPNWATEVAIRKGWNRLKEPSYTEYEVDLLTTIQTAWHLRISYQHTENDDRVALYMNVGLKHPDTKKNSPVTYYD